MRTTYYLVRTTYYLTTYYLVRTTYFWILLEAGSVVFMGAAIVIIHVKHIHSEQCQGDWKDEIQLFKEASYHRVLCKLPGIHVVLSKLLCFFCVYFLKHCT